MRACGSTPRPARPSRLAEATKCCSIVLRKLRFADAFKPELMLPCASSSARHTWVTVRVRVEGVVLRLGLDVHVVAARLELGAQHRVDSRALPAELAVEG